MLDKLCRKSWFPLINRLFSLLLFILVLFALFYGSIKILNFNFTSRVAMIAIWTLWWPLLYITLFFIARLWCGFICPLGLANEAGNYLHKSRLNVVRWSFLAYIIFFFVVLIEQISGLFLSVATTLTFFGGFFLVAFVIGILLPRFSFCRIICPVGTLLGVFSRLSLIGIRTDKDKCEKCKTKECLVGGKTEPCPMFNNVPKIDTNRNCLICANCIKNCPHNSSKIEFVKPGREIEEEASFSLSESLFIVALLGMVTILTTNGTRLVRKLQSLLGISIEGSLLRISDFFFVILLFILIFLLASLFSRSFRLKENITKSGYLYLPLLFVIMFFTITFGFLSPFLDLNEFTVGIAKYLFLLVGITWSMLLAYKMNSNNKISFFAHSFFILIIGLLWMFVLIAGPLNIVEANETVVYADDLIEMNAFSMGYDPSTIIAKEGQVIRIRLNDKDIDHAFDIDAFNIHVVLKGGESTEIMFMANKRGTFKYHCSVPGHTEAGMEGKLIIK